ncbi:outer membrane lipoprotein-sorting protein [Vibrio inusitatus NBRC 102082]|uniref:Outer membrane lipoprotein-sorting protein n=1 Tax=Vibrio inusitatus NBRC 102082 TaxID=1219070 RepID=A0A4Y3HU90_9VIBR|nr:outer membrane lipoprotein-sorting protein [Vibrio inusitatus]GEA50723.1 outer membrane lipoprotein-sorting protein [Vibrio inusitatus NBRC 102082]
MHCGDSEHSILLSILSLWLLLLVPFHSIHAQTLSASEVVSLSDQQMRGASGYSEMTMTIVRPTWSRSMSMKSWSKGLDLSLVLVTAPAKDKGSASLKRHNEMWNWIPSIEKVIKIAPSMLGQSWMGSDFTNDDLINQSSIVVDYQHVFTASEVIDGIECYVIEATAKLDAPVVWDKVHLWISKGNLLQRKVEFYDEFEELVSTMKTSDIKAMGGRNVASKMLMIPADKEGHHTEIEIHAAQFDFDIENGFFSQSQMRVLRD